MVLEWYDVVHGMGWFWNGTWYGVVLERYGEEV